MKNIILLTLILISNSAFSQQKQLRFEDYVYEPTIKSVLLYPQVGSAGNPAGSLNPPIAKLNENLTLEFDDLSGQFEQFHVKIIHCTMDWKQSVLSDIEFLPQFNDLIINDYQVSQNTKITFYHYKVEVPQVKISGNYLLVVLKDGRRNDYVITKRFVVYEPLVGASMQVRPAQDPALRKTHQQIDFEVSFGGYRLMSPRDELKLVVRQNYRWDRTIQGLKPFTVDEGVGRMKYSFFNNENVFPAANEFRFFDSRSTYNRGLYISRIQRGKEDDMWVSEQTNRSNFAYIESVDFDGLYVIDNRESGRGETEADYIWMTFALKTEELEADENVFINGGFNDWRLDKTNLMEYDKEYGGYTATIQLKQGVYNYNFVKVDKNGKTDESYFEGNFYDTQNTYEILIYHKPPTARAERVVGYSVQNFNKRR